MKKLFNIEFLKEKMWNNRIINELECKHQNIFNPCYLKDGEIEYYTYRASDNGKTHSFLLKLENNISSIVNLSNHFLTQNIKITADPKLFFYGNRVCITFNTGFNLNQNKLYICQVNNELVAQECIYIAREAVEKNWAFYSIKNNLFAIYSIFPLTILKLKEGNDKLIFELFYTNEVKKENVTIGTQLIAEGEKLYLLAHKKFYFLNKRLYLIKPICIHLNQQAAQLIEYNFLYSYSFKSLFGRFKKLNPNLISCSYASGLSKVDDNVIIGVGVNDLEAKLIKMRIGDVWK